MFKPPYLQPYKGKATATLAPLAAKESFTLYISGETNELINSKVGATANQNVGITIHRNNSILIILN